MDGRTSLGASVEWRKRMRRLIGTDGDDFRASHFWKGKKRDDGLYEKR